MLTFKFVWKYFKRDVLLLIGNVLTNKLYLNLLKENYAKLKKNC